MEVTGGVEDSEGPFWDIEGIKGERISGFLPIHAYSNGTQICAFLKI